MGISEWTYRSGYIWWRHKARYRYQFYVMSIQICPFYLIPPFLPNPAMDLISWYFWKIVHCCLTFFTWFFCLFVHFDDCFCCCQMFIYFYLVVHFSIELYCVCIWKIKMLKIKILLHECWSTVKKHEVQKCIENGTGHCQGKWQKETCRLC